MSHCKFEHPRHGSLAFRPRKRARALKPRLKGSQKDCSTKKPHFTCFLGYKAGMTQVMRHVNRPEFKKLHNKEVSEAVTYIETPPVVVVGVRGYLETPNGLKCMHTIFAQHLGEEFKRRLYKNWYLAKHKAFEHYAQLYENDETKKVLQDKINAIKKSCSVIKAVVHTQPSKINALSMKKGHIFEIPINGGTINEKVDFVTQKFEKQINICDLYEEFDLVDLAGITTGKGWQGVIKRFQVKRLQHKTRRGRRKVACIGAWHPAHISNCVPRSGQMGYHHRTIKNAKIYAIKNGSQQSSGSTEYDKTMKSINPLGGGFRHYGLIRNDCLMLKGSVMGPKRRPILIKNSCTKPKAGDLKEKIQLKFIDTAPQTGHGRFQTHIEKKASFGLTKKDLLMDIAKKTEQKSINV